RHVPGLYTMFMTPLWCLVQDFWQCTPQLPASMTGIALPQAAPCALYPLCSKEVAVRVCLPYDRSSCLVGSRAGYRGGKLPRSVTQPEEIAQFIAVCRRSK